MPCVADHLGGSQHVFVGLWWLDTDLIQNVLAVNQVLRVGHEGNRHDLAVDGDQLVLFQVAAMLGNQIIERANNVFVHQGNDRRVGDDCAGVFGRIALHTGQVDLLVVGGQVCRDLGPCTGLSASADGLNGGEFVADNADARADFAAMTARKGGGAGKCRQCAGQC